MSTNYHSLVRRLSGMGATDEEAARKKAASSDKALATAASKQGRAQKKADAALAVFVDAKKSVAEARTAHTEQATLLQVVIHNPPLISAVAHRGVALIPDPGARIINARRERTRPTKPQPQRFPWSKPWRPPRHC